MLAVLVLLLFRRNTDVSPRLQTFRQYNMVTAISENYSGETRGGGIDNIIRIFLEQDYNYPQQQP